MFAMDTSFCSWSPIKSDSMHEFIDLRYALYIQHCAARNTWALRPQIGILGEISMSNTTRSIADVQVECFKSAQQLYLNARPKQLKFEKIHHLNIAWREVNILVHSHNNIFLASGPNISFIFDDSGQISYSDLYFHRDNLTWSLICAVFNMYLHKQRMCREGDLSWFIGYFILPAHIFFR
jgi:hypothetical protein